MSRKISSSNERDICSFYEAGMSPSLIEKKIGVSSAGVELRGMREAQQVRSIRMTQEEKNTLVANAHAAVRGCTHSEEHRAKIAKTNEIKGNHIFRTEKIIGDSLAKHGLTITYQKAIGRYNVDVAVHEGSIAVEIFGGGWHGKGRHAERFVKRCDYLLDNGWLPLIVWVDGRRHPLEYGAIKYIVSLSKALCSGESVRRQEQMIWGNGDITVCGCFDFNYRPAIMSRISIDNSGRNN